MKERIIEDVATNLNISPQMLKNSRRQDVLFARVALIVRLRKELRLKYRQLARMFEFKTLAAITHSFALDRELSRSIVDGGYRDMKKRIQSINLER